MSNIRSKLGSYILKRFYGKKPSVFSKGGSKVAVSSDKPCPDPMEVITGKAKRELLAIKAGITDPYNNDPVKRMQGSSEKCPNILRSVNNERIVGCFCEEDAYQPFYWKIQTGKPVRCCCGHWFELVQVEKIVTD